MHFKISTCNFRRFLEDLGIKNKRLVFIFGMYIEETGLHTYRLLKKMKNVDFIHLYKKNAKSLRRRNQNIENPRQPSCSAYISTCKLLVLRGLL